MFVKNRVKIRTRLYSHMHVFYQPDITLPFITLSEEESKHCVRVLRLQNGDKIFLADGNGKLATAQITDNHPKKCVLQIVSVEQFLREESSGRQYYLHIMIAPTKNMERVEWFIEKATEVGIDEITFIETENSERNKVNMVRCLKIAISAMKQSKQWYFPKINELKSLKEIIQQPLTGAKYVAWCDVDKTQLFSNMLDKQENSYTVLIGPEGDFTTQEINACLQSGFVPVSFGATILRTETAALYGVMAIKALHS